MSEKGPVALGDQEITNLPAGDPFLHAKIADLYSQLIFQHLFVINDVFLHQILGNIIEVQAVIFIGAESDLVLEHFPEGTPGEIGHAFRLELYGSVYTVWSNKHRGGEVILGEEGKDVLLEVLLSVVEGEAERTSVGDALFPLHGIKGIIYGQELEVIVRQMLNLFPERTNGKPQLVKLGGSAHILILDDGKFLQLHGDALSLSRRYANDFLESFTTRLRVSIAALAKDKGKSTAQNDQGREMVSWIHVHDVSPPDAADDLSNGRSSRYPRH